MPANKYALLRYRIIDRCIRSKGQPYPSKEDLRSACEEALYGSDGEHISISTIEKDIWAMRNEGELGFYAPITFSKQHRGYYYEDSEYTIAELPLTDDDLSAIKSAAQTLFQFRDIPLFSQFDTAIEKILDRMKISTYEQSDATTDVIQFERGGTYKGSEFLEPLFLAARDTRTVTFDYQKFNSNEKRQVNFHPYLLKEYKNRWYAIGMDQDRAAMRTYSLDRIVFLRVNEEYYNRLDSFDVQSFFKHSVGITVTDEKPQVVRLRFFSKLAPYIMSRPLHDSQIIIRQDDQSIEVELRVLVTIELISEILGFGDQVEVVAPNFLRVKVKEALTKCLKKY
ncbi:MAG: WYL domain-containing protein [Salibacteraceae bacterium]